MAKLPKKGSPLVLRVAIAIPLYRHFDYIAPHDVAEDELTPGIRLEVPFGTGKKIAYLIETSQTSKIAPDKLKPIVRILDDKPLLSAQDIKLLLWASRYYHHPLGDVFSTAFPASLRSGKAASLYTQEKHYGLTELGQATTTAQLKRSPKQ